MKIVFVSLLSWVVFQTESFYSFSVKNLEGNHHSMSVCQGNKAFVVTLPVQQNSQNESFLHSLDSLKGVFQSSLIIIAVPSYEDGFSPSLKNQLKQWYRSILRAEIIIADGLYTRKTSGGQQHALFRWLTDKDKNGHFNQDVAGPGHKFLVNSQGKLYAVLGGPSRIGSGAMDRLLRAE